MSETCRGFVKSIASHLTFFVQLGITQCVYFSQCQVSADFVWLVFNYLAAAWAFNILAEVVCLNVCVGVDSHTVALAALEIVFGFGEFALFDYFHTFAFLVLPSLCLSVAAVNEG